MAQNTKTIGILWGISGAALGGLTQGALNYLYAWLTGALWGWPSFMQWMVLYDSRSFWGLWHVCAGVILGAVAGLCFFVCRQGRPQEAAKRALKVGLGATLLCLGYAGFIVYAYSYGRNDLCGTGAMLPAPTGLRSFTAMAIGPVVFTNVPLQCSLLLCTLGWRWKRKPM